MNNRQKLINKKKNSIDHSFNQILLLDHNSSIVESCDTLFSTHHLRTSPAIHWSPFIESIFSHLITQDFKSSEIAFSRIEQPLPDLQGFYDFTFLPVTIDKEKYILWTIYDFTEVYKKRQVEQQYRQELEIERQKLENNIHHLSLKKSSIQSKKRS